MFAGIPNLLADQVGRVSLVVEAVIIQKLGVEHDELMECDGPRVRVRFGVIDGEFDLETSVVDSPEPLGDLRGIGHGAALAVEPGSVAEADGVGDQGVAIPLCGRKTIPRRVGILGQRTAIGEYLPVGDVAL